MRAVVCSEFAPLDHLTLIDVDPAPCAAGQVRVQISAAGVNFVDALFVQGLYQVKPKLPYIPGNEVAGRVAEVGEGVAGLAVGDRVFAAMRGGGFASEVVLDAHLVMPTPDNLTDGQAATFAQSYLTALFALRQRGNAQPGQWLLVLGAGGGVGLAAVDVGHAMGLRVIAAASTAEKRAAALACGAEVVVDTTTQDTKAVAREVADGDGVHLVYDPVGGDLGEQCLRALRDDGQFLVIGFASGTVPKLPANQVLLRNRRVIGVEWGPWAERHPVENDELMRWLLAGIAGGAMTPVEPTPYPLDAAARALADQQNRRVTGKTVLVP